MCAHEMEKLHKRETERGREKEKDKTAKKRTRETEREGGREKETHIQSHRYTVRRDETPLKD